MQKETTTVMTIAPRPQGDLADVIERAIVIACNTDEVLREAIKCLQDNQGRLPIPWGETSRTTHANSSGALMPLVARVLAKNNLVHVKEITVYTEDKKWRQDVHGKGIKTTEIFFRYLSWALNIDMGRDIVDPTSILSAYRTATTIIDGINNIAPEADDVLVTLGDAVEIAFKGVFP